MTKPKVNATRPLTQKAQALEALERLAVNASGDDLEDACLIETALESLPNAEDLILRALVIAAVGGYIVWRDLLVPLLRLIYRVSTTPSAPAPTAPQRLRIVHRPAEELDPSLVAIADEAGIDIPIDAGNDELACLIMDADDYHRHGHPSLSAAERNRPDARGFL